MAGFFDDLVDGIKEKLDSADQYLSKQLGTEPTNSPKVADAQAVRDGLQEKLETAQAAQAQDNAPLVPRYTVTKEDLPPIGPATKTIQAGQAENTDQTDFRVRIRAFPNTWNEVYGDPLPENIMFPLHPEAKSDGFLGMNGMVFPYTPTITWAQSVQYNAINVVHANQDFQAYSHTPSQTFTITGPFTAQNPQEARYMLACMHFLRTVTKMRYGQSKNLGLPPPVLLLSGYGKYIFNDLPVIITQYTFEYNNNVDMVPVYIPGNKGEPVAWVPSLQNISVSVTVQQTPNKLRQFDFDKFASGTLLDDKKGGWI